MAMESLPDNVPATRPEDVRRPPMDIPTALRDYCYIPGDYYCVIAMGHDRPPNILASQQYPNLGVEQLKRYLNVDGLERRWKQVQSDSCSELRGLSYDIDYEASHPASLVKRPRTQNRSIASTPRSGNLDGDNLPTTRKRPRTGITRERNQNTEDDLPARVGPTQKHIVISDEKAIWDYYERCLKKCQQGWCKILGKEMVRLIHPKKQSGNPYSREAEGAPSWWPIAHVPHREPDHLLKPERLYLLPFMIRMVVEPRHKHCELLQRQDVNIKKLEEVSWKGLSKHYNFTEPKNHDKVVHLKQLFKVARQEESYKNGEIDPTSTVYVDSDDGYYPPDPDDDEKNEQAGSMRFEGEDRSPTPMLSGASSSPQPDTPQSLMVQSQASDQTTTSHLTGIGFSGSPAVRDRQHSHRMLASEIVSEQTTYLGDTHMTDHTPIHPDHHLGLGEVYPSVHESSRRTSIFNSPTGYTGPPTPSIYSTWQGPPAPSNTPAYGFQPQNSGIHSSFAGHQGVPMPPTQPYIHPFDAQARGVHDQEQNHMLRRGNSQHQQPQQTGYQTYMLPDIDGLP